ncbi:ABC transporter substrate-binding protein [Ferrovibrio sp.]|uniref:ABC transporter substrate-binding protein n=1 Tax=Ferrovibrio sp. TaxID=1917215 RepID=UPI0025BBCA4E|nr:ABC transporter substrate-binding protein [Ferrovibrio sp.]MBX3452934.1 ABC transporter substrate-binding protein [Ferrovibrio sp.]
MKRTMHSLGIMAAAAMVWATGPAWASGQGVTDTEIVIGNVLPMSGAAAITGRAAHLGTVVAAAEINAAGGINGRKIKVVTEDDGYVPARSFQSLKKMLADGMFALIGTSGNAGLAAMLPVLEEEKVPTIVTLSPSLAAVNPVRPNIFMLGASYEDMLFAQLKYIKENRSPKGKLGLLRQDDDFGNQVELAFKRAEAELKVETIPPIRFKRGQSDFSAEVLKLRSSGIGWLISGGPVVETPAMMKELMKYQLNIPVTSVPTGMLAPVVKLAAATGMNYFSADYVSTLDSEGTAHFRKLATQYLSAAEQADMSRYSVTAYVSSLLMFNAIKTCGKNVTRDCVSEKLASNKNVDTTGITPPLSFGKDHIAAKAIRVIEVMSTENKLVERTPFAEY